MAAAATTMTTAIWITSQHDLYRPRESEAGVFFKACCMEATVTSITLTGCVVDVDLDATDMPTECSVGDVKLYGQLDADGRAAIRGGHANLGYSGSVSASVWDGTKWCRLNVSALIEYKTRHYPTQADKMSAIERTARCIKDLKGIAVTQGVLPGRKQRVYALPSQFIEAKSE